jgi:hypothetical protein
LPIPRLHCRLRVATTLPEMHTETVAGVLNDADGTE